MKNRINRRILWTCLFIVMSTSKQRLRHAEIFLFVSDGRAGMAEKHQPPCEFKHAFGRIDNIYKRGRTRRRPFCLTRWFTRECKSNADEVRRTTRHRWSLSVREVNTGHIYTTRWTILFDLPLPATIHAHHVTAATLSGRLWGNNARFYTWL